MAPEGLEMASVSDRHAGGSPRTLKRCPLGQTIERLAVDRGLHLDEVARAAGITFPTLHRICTGRIKSPKLETVKAIAAALHVKIDRLAK
jgi:transcriptional regulator with XRE-family HTH domain